MVASSGEANATFAFPARMGSGTERGVMTCGGVLMVGAERLPTGATAVAASTRATAGVEDRGTGRGLACDGGSVATATTASASTAGTTSQEERLRNAAII